MKKLLLAAVLTAAVFATAGPAKADLVLSDLVFRDLGGTGFGVAPRLLTTQTTANANFEAGGVVAGAGGSTVFVTGSSIVFNAALPQGFTGTTGCTTNQTCNGTEVNQTNVFSVASLGWNTGAQVGIGLDTNEVGSTDGLLFNSLVLTLYNSAGTVLGSFSGNGPVFISQALLDAQQGNGNSVFDIRLDAAQQAQYDAILAANGGAANVYEGLAASFGCLTAGCSGAATDGAESFLAFQAAAVPGPIVGAGLPGMLAACFGLWGLHRRRRSLAQG